MSKYLGSEVMGLIGAPLNHGWKLVRKFGYRTGIGTSTEDIRFGGAARIYWPLAAEKLRIKSGGDAADDAAGTGAQSVIIYGLDDDGNEISETLTTAGVVASAPSVLSFRRAYRAIVSGTGTYFNEGSGGTPVANLTIEGVDSGKTYMVIPAGAGQSQTTSWTMPAGHKGIITEFSFSADPAKQTVTTRLHLRGQAFVTSAPFGVHRIIDTRFGLSGPVSPLELQLDVDELTDIWMCAGATSGGGADVFGGFTVLYRPV